MPTGTPVSHTDSIQPISSRGDGNYTAPTEYKRHPEKEGYGSVASRNKGLALVHPVDDVETLHKTAHLQAQLHKHNRDQWETKSPHPNDGTLLYDLKILNVADEALSNENLGVAALDIPDRRFKALFLKAARSVSNVQSFYDYLKNSPLLLSALGYTDPSDLPSYGTFRREDANRLPDELDELERGQEAFENASIRAVYAVFRNGIVPPKPVREKNSFDAFCPPFYERSIRRDDEQYALRNWVRVLTDKTLRPLTFGRDKGRFDILHYLGLLATSAESGSGLQTAAKVVDWDHPRDAIPKGSGLPKYIRKLPLSQREFQTGSTPAINEQFDAVHNETLSYARDLGFFSKPLPLAVDLYCIEWTGSESAPTINRPAKFENEVRSEWTFVVIGIIAKEARFTLGTRWLRGKYEYPDAVKQIIPGPPDHFDVEAVYADSEMISGDLMDAFSAVAGSDWIVRAPNPQSIQNLKKLTPKNYVGYAPSIPWNRQPKPNAVVYPYGGNEPSLVRFHPGELKGDASIPTDERLTTLLDYTEDNSSKREVPSLFRDVDDPASLSGVGNQSTHAAYFTGRTLPEYSGEEIHFRYYQRWALEESINQISNHFMPVVHSDDPKLRTYGVNIAILFQNWHTLINRAASPDLGLRLSITHQELFKAIQHVAFNRTEQS